MDEVHFGRQACMLLRLPEELLGRVASHLEVWERISTSQACRSFHHVARNLPYGDFAQVKNKHYLNVQLVDEYKEWSELRRMKLAGMSVVFAPQRFTLFVRAYHVKKARLQRSL